MQFAELPSRTLQTVTSIDSMSVTVSPLPEVPFFFFFKLKKVAESMLIFTLHSVALRGLCFCLSAVCILSSMRCLVMCFAHKDVKKKKKRSEVGKISGYAIM